MKTLLAIIPLFLAACSGGSDSTQEQPKRELFLVGDSLCFQDDQADAPIAWPTQLNIKSDCVPGRGIAGLLPDRYNMPAGDVIIAIGTNNSLWNRPLPDNFAVAYDQVVQSVTGVAWCVLPQGEEYQAAVRSVCTNIIDAPQPDDPDGIHYLQAAHNEQVELFLEVYGNR